MASYATIHWIYSYKNRFPELLCLLQAVTLAMAFNLSGLFLPFWHGADIPGLEEGDNTAEGAWEL